MSAAPGDASGAKTAPPVAAPEPAANTGKRARPGFAVILCAAAAIAVGVLAAWFYGYLRDDQDRRAALDTRWDELAATQSRLHAELSGIAAGLTALQTVTSDLRTAVDELTEARAATERAMRALAEREPQVPADWVLAEAEYLVLAAMQRLALEGDVLTAVAALHAADRRLEAAARPDLIPVREQLLRDITALEAVKLPDGVGLAMYLAEVMGQVGRLPTRTRPEPGDPPPSIRDPGYTPTGWRELLRALWSDLVSLVEVKDAELPEGLVFDPKLHYFLEQNLRLELASARHAVLRRDTANLRAAVTVLQGVLNTYYAVDDASVAALLEHLETAARIDLAPALPDLSGALAIIRRHRQDRAGSETGPAVYGDAP